MLMDFCFYCLQDGNLKINLETSKKWMWKLLTCSFQNVHFLFFGSQNICLFPIFLYHTHSYFPQNSPKSTKNYMIILCMFSPCCLIVHSKPKTWEPSSLACSQNNTTEITLYTCHISPKNVLHMLSNISCISLRSHWLTYKNFQKLVSPWLSKLSPLFLSSHSQLY